MQYLIGLDLGTTATKAVLFKTDGVIVSTSSKPYKLYRDATGMAEEEFEDIFDAVLASVREVCINIEEGDELLAVSFSAQMHSWIAYDENWEALTRVITWADTRAVHYTEALKASNKAYDIYRKTGTPTHPMAPLSKSLWLKNEKPYIFNRAAHYLDLKGAIFHRLFGVKKMDLSIATGTGLFNIKEKIWDPETLEVTGLLTEQLPEVVSPYEIERGMQEEFAFKMGIPADTPFVWGAGDGPLSNLGVAAIRPGVAAITIGTSGAIRVVTDKPETDVKAKTFTYALDEDHWVVGGPVNSGGDVFRWLRDQVFDGELTFDEITALAKEVGPGAAGLLFHPYLGGERAPLWDANARGSFFGLNYGHTRSHMARSLLEGVMFNLYMVALSLREVAGDVKQIQATGGFTSSKLWTQILSDIFEQPITVPDSTEAGCLAATVMAQKALGLIDSLEAVEGMVGSNQTFMPNEESYETYRALMPIYLRLSSHFSEEYADIAALQRKLSNQ
ncbi:gluconokinase [Lactococcus termiticola]|uniref:Gluconate kinase n=1 Tax=Lactococcus termiticola TaxID=2169526 RepID=A0A2R5HDM7_9LACT|nr:gluconokinase [Lactococcus termiticola]GBG96163.1 gluconate kinase [Lactococcus termiticola]